MLPYQAGILQIGAPTIGAILMSDYVYLDSGFGLHVYCAAKNTRITVQFIAFNKRN